MKLSHINVTMPKGAENIARSFYSGLLGLREIPKPELLRGRGGLWFDADGLDIHLSPEEPRLGAISIVCSPPSTWIVFRMLVSPPVYRTT